MSTTYVIDDQVSGPNALRIEHERHDIGSERNRDVDDLLDKARGQSVLSVFGRGFSEELPSAARLEKDADYLSEGQPVASALPRLPD